MSDQENGAEHDLTVAQDGPAWITSEEAISEVHRYTGRPRSVCVKWIEDRCSSGRMRYEDHGTKLREDWDHCDPKTGQPFVKDYHLFLVDYNDLMSELISEAKSVDESQPQNSRAIKLTDGLSARRRVEEAAQWAPEAAQVWLCHALVAGRVRGWRAGSVKSACVPELDPRKYNIGFWEGMPISVSGGPANFYLGTVCVDVASLDEALSSAFSQQQKAEQEPKTATRRGRPEKDFWPAVRFEAGAWLGLNGGEDEGGSQSALADFLMLRAEAHGSSLGKSQAMSKAKEMIAVFRRLKNEGSL